MITANLTQAIRIKLDRLWIIGRDTYIRFYPNPGFAIVILGRRLSWSKFYGWKYGSVR